MEEVNDVVRIAQVILLTFKVFPFDAGAFSTSAESGMFHGVDASHKVEETNDKVEQVDCVVRVPKLHKSIDASIIHAASGSMGGIMYM